LAASAIVTLLGNYELSKEAPNPLTDEAKMV
jgi:hypothetical protein